MEEQFFYRKYTDSDFNNYCALFENVYSHKINKPFFEWKHKLNESTDNLPLIYLVFNNTGDLIGSNSFFKCEFEFANKTYDAVQSGDTMIHADYRGKGLFKKLVQFAMVDLKDCGFDFIFGFANNNSHPGFVKLNFETLYQINNYIKILNYQVVLQNKLTFLPFAKHIGKIVDKFKNQLAFSSKYNIISTNDLSEEITNFISSNISNKIFQKRDLGLLSWKYLQKPYSNYEILLIKKDKIIESVFFIRIEDDEMNSVTIMDYFIGNDKNLPKVLKEIIKYYRNKNKGYLQTWEIGSNLYINALHKNHLIKRNLELYFIIKPLKEDFDDFKNLNLWHITNSDSDTA